MTQIERPIHQETLFAAQAEWSPPPAQRAGVQHYVDLLLNRWKWIALAVLIALAAAGAHLATTPDTYQATADVLVTPIPRGSTSFVGLGLPMESDDPTRDVETASRLIKTEAVAARVRSGLGLSLSDNALLGEVQATPVAQASLVAVTATSASPQRAAQVANAFVRATIAERTARLNAQLDVLIPELQNELKQVAATQRASDPLNARLRDLQGLRLTGDPTIQLETEASPPSSPAGPKKALTLIAAFLGSLILAVCVIIALQAFDTRLRSEDELRRYRLPILARIPVEGSKLKFTSDAHSPLGMPIGMRDSYRLLATSLRTMNGGGQVGSVLVTGPTPADGKSTTALCLASALAAQTEDVVLIELDTRAPSLARVLEVTPPFDLADVSQRRVSLAKALITAWKGEHAGRLRMLLVRREPSLMALPGATTNVMDQAEALGGWLMVDAPALNYVADALPVAKRVDSVVIVVRIGNTRIKELDTLAELFAQHGIVPTGFVLVGTKNKRYYGELAEFTPLSSPAEVPAPAPAPVSAPAAAIPRKAQRRNPS